MSSPALSLRAILVGALLAHLVVGCHKDEPTRVQLADVERCERGIAEAERQHTPEEAARVYYEECANVYVAPGCRSAVLGASKVPMDKQLVAIAEGCRTAYCPTLPGASELEICKAGFKLTPESAVATWPPFHNAILGYDARSLAPRIMRDMVAFYGHMVARTAMAPIPPPPPSGEVPPVPASAVAPASSASAGSPGASAAPPLAPSASAGPKP